MNLQTLFGLNGKTALVTGGATGIGRMATTGLVAAGAHVIIASRKIEVCQLTADEINSLGYEGRVTAISGDVASEDGIEYLVKTVLNETDQLHILMNNAGRTWGAPLGSFPHSAWNKVFDLNVAGMFAQFLTPAQVWQLSALADQHNLPVMCYGLRTDFKGKLFPGAAELLAIADVLREIRTICHCGRKATMVT